jgi:hypothetical protein
MAADDDLDFLYTSIIGSAGFDGFLVELVVKGRCGTLRREGELFRAGNRASLKLKLFIVITGDGNVKTVAE